jgi:DNA-directed RNA polymerase specialized sigma24 family protein
MRTPVSPEPTSPSAPADDRAALLRAQPWGRLLASLTAIALKRIKGRSLADAEDLAQGAIVRAYRSRESGGWDPEKGPLEKYLVARVISSAANEQRRKRNVCEVWLDEEAEEAPGLCVHEAHLAEDAPAPDEALHRLRFASTFDARLTARVAGNEVATALLPFMREGMSVPRDLAAATGRPIADIRAALRVLRYQAEAITKELSAMAVPSRAGSNDSDSKEVFQ